jgi:hypothetical protein
MSRPVTPVTGTGEINQGSHMSDANDVPRRVLPANRSTGSKLWICCSFALTAVILVWTFSLPFQSESSLTSIRKQGAQAPQIDLVQQVALRRSEAEQYRAEAIALDKDLMRAVAERNAPKTDLPGIKHVRRKWQQTVADTQRQLELLGNPQPGTVEWDYAERLLRTLEDGPESE